MKSKTKIILAIWAAVLVAIIGVTIAIHNARAADQTYNVLNNLPKTLADMGDSTYAEVITGRTQYHSYYSAVALTGDTYFVLIDLSDTTNYPHSATNDIVITGWHHSMNLSDAVVWLYCLGVVTAIDGSGATARVFTRPFPDISATFTVHQSVQVPGGGIEGSNVMAADTSIAAVTTSTDLASPAGTTQAQVGDIIIIADEVSGSGALTFSVGLSYWTK